MTDITRTITIYRHHFGKLEITADGPKITDACTVDLTEKLGERKAKKYIKDVIQKDVALLKVEEFNKKYAMKLDFFIANAVEVALDAPVKA